MKQHNNYISTELSLAIEWLRPVLMLLVIFVHVAPSVHSFSESDIPVFSNEGLFNIIGITFSHVVGGAAVPAFFFISGFLFFCNVEQLTWSQYKLKIQSRIKTLVIPYILWNLIAFLLELSRPLVKYLTHQIPLSEVTGLWSNNKLHILWDCGVWGETVNYLGWPKHCTGPFDSPLWYLRDLIIVSFSAPIIYLIVKSKKGCALLLLFILYILNTGSPISGVSPAAFFFFSFGAFFAYNRIDLIQFVRNNRGWIITLFFMLLLPCIYYNSPCTIIGDAIHSFFVIPAIFLFFLIAVYFQKKTDAKNIIYTLSGSCFFVYALHTINVFISYSPISLAKKLSASILFTDNWIIKSLGFIASALLTYILCYVIFILLKRYLPKVNSVLTGR